MTARQPQSREEAKMLGLPDWQIEQMFPEAPAVEPQQPQQAPEQAQAPQGGLLGSSTRPQGFWQGGEKFRARDGLAGLLAVVGDAFSRNSGGEGFATQGLLGGRLDAQEMARKKAEEQAALAQMMAVGQANGLTPEQVQAQALGLKLPEPDEFTRMAQRGGLSPEEMQQAARRKAMGDPYLTGAPLPNGGQYYGYASGIQNFVDGGQQGDTPMTPEEIRAMGLPEGGPGGNRPGGFRR